MTLLIIFLVFGAVLLGIAAIKNQIVYRARIKATEMWSWEKMGNNWRKAHNVRDSYGSYNKMFYNIKGWSFDGLYPGYEERLKNLEQPKKEQTT